MAKIKVRRGGGLFGKLIALILGILIGIVAGIGGLAGGIYYAISIPKIRDILGLVEGMTGDIPAEDYVTDTYLDKSLLNAIMDSSTVIGGIAGGGNTFGDLTAISPYVNELSNTITTTLSNYGIKITNEEFLAMSVPDVGPYLQTQIGNIAIPALLSLAGQTPTPDNKIMCAFLYGKEHVVYEIATADDGSKTIELLPLTYLLQDDGTFTDWKDNVYSVSDSTTWSNEDGTILIKEESAKSENGEIDYVYAVYENKDDTSTLKYRLAPKADDENAFEAYANDEKQIHVGMTINDLMQGTDMMAILNDMELGALLELDASSDSLMLNLAYGEDGWKITDGVLEVTTDSPMTVYDLTQNGSDIVKDMSIGSLLGLDASSDPLMLSLAYGKKGTDYDVVDGELKVLTATPKTIKDLTENGSDIVKDMALGSLLGLDASSDSLMLNLAYGEDGWKITDGVLEVTTDSPMTVRDLTDGGTDMIGDMTLASVLGLDKNNASSISRTMKALAFGSEGEDYDMVDNKIVMKEGKKEATINDLKSDDTINRLKIGDLIEITETSPAVLKALENSSLSSLSDDINGLVINDVIEINESSSQILKTLDGTPINSLASKIDSLKLEDVMVIDSSSPLILQNLTGTPVANLGTRINELTLDQMIPGVSDNPILSHMSDSTINTLSDDLDHLTVQQIFDKDVYKSVIIYKDASDVTVYEYDKKYFTDTAFSVPYTGDVSALTEVEYYFLDKNGKRLYYNDVNETYYTTDNFVSGTESERVLVGTWKYLLGEKQSDGTFKDTPCAITHVPDLIGHMTENIQSASLSDLSNDGILVFDESTAGILDKKIKNDSTGNKVGDYTIIELILILGTFTE